MNIIVPPSIRERVFSKVVGFLLDVGVVWRVAKVPCCILCTFFSMVRIYSFGQTFQ